MCSLSANVMYTQVCLHEQHEYLYGFTKLYYNRILNDWCLPNAPEKDGCQALEDIKNKDNCLKETKHNRPREHKQKLRLLAHQFVQKQQC